MRSSDIVIENFRPEVAERLGIGYEVLRPASQGDLLLLPGLDRTTLAACARVEPIIGASTGLYPPHHASGHGEAAGMGLSRGLPPLPIASTYAAMLGVVCITVALYARHHTQRGQRLEVPLHSAMFTAMGRHLVKF